MCSVWRHQNLLLTTVSSVAVQRYISRTLTISPRPGTELVLWTWTLPFCNLLCYLSFFLFFFMNLCPAFSARYWRGLCAWKLIFCVLTVVFFLLNSSSRRPEEYQTRTVFVNTARRWAIEINVVLEKQLDSLLNVHQCCRRCKKLLLITWIEVIMQPGSHFHLNLLAETEIRPEDLKHNDGVLRCL